MDAAAIRVDGKLKIDHTIFGDHFEYLKSRSRRPTPKLTIPSPNMVHYRGGPAAIDPAVYPDPEEFWDDLAAAYADEIPGCTSSAAPTCSSTTRASPTSTTRPSAPSSPHAATTPSTAPALHQQINDAIADKPAGMTHHHAHVPRQLPLLLGRLGRLRLRRRGAVRELDVDGFFLEYDDERSGGFEPLRFVPQGKLVVLGLVTTKRGALEDQDELKRRIEEASEYVPLDQLCLSPQCGFSSTVEGNALTQDEQLAKLELVVEIAADVWG